MSEYLGETSSNRKIPVQTARVHIWFLVSVVCICLVGPFLLCRLNNITTTTATTSAYNNDNGLNIRNGSFDNCRQISLH